MEKPVRSAEFWATNYGDSLYRYAMSAVGDPVLADELVQETYLAGIEAIDKFKGKSAVKSWLIGILKHKIADYYRQKSRYVQMEDSQLENAAAGFDQSFDKKGRWINPPGEWPVSPEDEVERKQIAQILAGCIDLLPERMGRLYRLREIEGEATKEVCKQMEISQTNLWVMMHRARCMLRSCIEKKLKIGK